MIFARSKECARGLSIVLLSLACTYGYATSVKPIITLDPPAGATPSAQALSPSGHVPPGAPANFRHLGEATVGQVGNVEPLTLHFAEQTKLESISSTPDFVIEPGGTCIEGDVYKAGDTCRLLVRFTPQGPGNRVGKVKITHTASLTPDYVGLGGYGSAPVVSFTPALISTVGASSPGGVGLMKGAQNLAVDGGDTLYVADTGNNVIRSYDSSGKFITISSGTLSAPLGVAVDSFGEVFFDEPAQNALFEIFDYGYQLQVNGTGNPTCTVASPCSIEGVSLYSPGQMSIDASNQLFYVNDAGGAAVSQVQSYPANYANLSDPFNFQTAASGAFAVDAYDNLYSAYEYGSAVCAIVSQTYGNAANSLAIYQKVAGGKTCGFAGDGGQARNAEIGSAIGQITFDIAGNLYFTDSANQRVRRIDNATGIIHTIAGNGTSGNSGDGGQSTSAELRSPTGVAVDSQGQVYILSKSASTGTNQVVRKLGPNGIDTFGSVLKGSSLSKIVNMANTGNSALTITSVRFTGTNASDFSLDPNTTSCNFAAGGSLANGQNCQIGIVFKPSAAGARSANLVLLDNSVTDSNTVQLTGTGTLPSAVVKMTAPASGASVASGTTVKATASVSSASGAAPTGNVTFKVDGEAYGSAVKLASGAASVNLIGLTAKTHTISATYNGDGNYAASTVSESITVKAAAVTGGPIGPPGKAALALAR